MNTITSDEIKNIIEKYNIGKRPLSIILGLGEVTITRYLNCESNPSSQISELLYSVSNNPDVFIDYLEKNKDKISPVAYGKAKTAVSKLLNLSNERDDVLEGVAKYILEKNEGTTNLVLQKLLYYCQVFSYILLNKPMFKTTCNAWEHGPVYEDIYYKYKINGNNPIEINNECSIAKNNKMIVDAVIRNFGCFSGPVLCYFTHSETPWKKSYECGTNISLDDIKAFAQKIKEEYKINDINDIENYANYSIRNFKKNSR